MPIPTAFDHQLAEVEALAACVTTKLRVLHHGTAKRDTSELRELLQSYVDHVMALARDER